MMTLQLSRAPDPITEVRVMAEEEENSSLHSSGASASFMRHGKSNSVGRWWTEAAELLPSTRTQLPATAVRRRRTPSRARVHAIALTSMVA
mmetsp:Transcript_3160/g.9223  ORF Transcript_3160/g.9223 Transcript_3160/m.9223 type:complete len:91 (+) Transcript_3160:171-443(+)